MNIKFKDAKGEVERVSPHFGEWLEPTSSLSPDTSGWAVMFEKAPKQIAGYPEKELVDRQNDE